MTEKADTVVSLYTPVTNLFGGFKTTYEKLVLRKWQLRKTMKHIFVRRSKLRTLE